MTEPDSTTGGEQSRTPGSTQSGWCGSTDWTAIILAGRANAPGSAQALEELCRRYWPPVYAYIRRRGHKPCQTEDLTQSFITSFIESGVLAGLDESKGRFRSFLLVCLKNFLANEWNRSQAQKRGGGRPLVSLDAMAAEETYCAAATSLSPDAAYEKRWALALLAQALAQLETEEVKAGRGVEFRRLQALMTGDGAEDSYQAAGAELGMSREAVGMAVHRLRQRFREALRTQIAATVPPGQVEEEMRCLMAALRQN